MELGLPASLPSEFARRAAPIAGGGALVAAATFVATHNPASSTSPFPACAFHQATGLWCPGCGLTRGVYQLVHGHLASALSYNLFTPLAVIAIVFGWLCWVRASWGASPIRVPQRVQRWLVFTVPALLLIYGVLRNLPVAPLRSLAP
jgi:hypothetical protein